MAGLRRRADRGRLGEGAVLASRTTGGPCRRSSSASPTTPTRATASREVTTRDYCSKSVGAWLGYPVDYDYGYTWFHEAEWDAGNRRSVCWAKTSQ